LIIHLEALGAVLRATVLLRAIKRRWPLSHITWITQPIATPLLENNPFIDRLLKNDHQGVLSLSTLQFDFSFCLDKSLVAGGLLEIPEKAGVRRGFGVDGKTGVIIPLNLEANRLYELGLSNHEKFFVNKKPETQLLVEALGLEAKRDEYVFRFTVEENEDIRQKGKQLGLRPQQVVIGLNTGCSAVIPYKKLSEDGWVELAQKIQKSFPAARLLLLGGPEDSERNVRLSQRLPEVILTPTEGGLRQGLKYVSLCNVVVTGDSLGMHMAIALKKWVVAWFGPTCAHEIDLYERGRAVLSKAPCSPCWKRHCSQSKMCYDLVSFEQMIEGIKAGLTTEKFFAPAAKKPTEVTL
jgi:heptosyltransferase-2